MCHVLEPIVFMIYLVSLLQMIAFGVMLLIFAHESQSMSKSNFYIALWYFHCWITLNAKAVLKKN